MSSVTKSSNQDGRTTFERALAGYDPAFEKALVDEIARAIAMASVVTDRKVIAIRTGETIAALATCLAATLAMCPEMDTPSRLRETVEQLGKRIRKQTAAARAEGLADSIGAGKGGHA